MKAPTRVVAGALAVVCGVAALWAGLLAQAPTEMAGTWKMVSAKSTFSPGPAPKSMAITYTPLGESMKIEVDTVTADGVAQRWSMTAAYDGKPASVVGNPDADTIVLKRIDANRGESTFSKGGKVMAVNSRTLSADGKTLTIVTKGVNAKGQPRNDVAVYTR